jgi:hypothetical protein
MKKTFIYSLILFAFSSSCLKAQSVILATGMDASGGNGSVSYSIGQTAYFYKGAGNQVLEGVQQPYEITTLSTREKVTSDLKDILLYLTLSRIIYIWILRQTISKEQNTSCLMPRAN